jgi:hypothetical protein
MGLAGTRTDTAGVTREEEQLEADRLRKMRRQPLILLGVLNALVLAVGTTAALDLRRLQTPRGTALAWVEAAVFGDCSVYRELSVPDRGTVERRTGTEVCKDLKAATGTARAHAGRIALLPGTALERGGTATSAVGVRRPEGDRTVTVQVEVQLRKVDGRWRVVRDAATCQALGCA